MISCRNCGADIDDKSKFCYKCGTKVEKTCFKCGTVLDDKAVFCSKCGANLDASNDNGEEYITNAKGWFNEVCASLSFLLYCGILNSIASTILYIFFLILELNKNIGLDIVIYVIIAIVFIVMMSLSFNIGMPYILLHSEIYKPSSNYTRYKVLTVFLLIGTSYNLFFHTKDYFKGIILCYNVIFYLLFLLLVLYASPSKKHGTKPKNKKSSIFKKVIFGSVLIFSIFLNFILANNYTDEKHKVIMYFVNDLNSDVYFSLLDDEGKVLVEDTMEREKIVEYKLMPGDYIAKYECSSEPYNYMSFNSEDYDGLYVYLSDM